jgi:hypothetical protein
MDGGQIAILIMQILTLLASIIAPLVSAFAYLLKHISESSCCGGGIKVREPSSNSLNTKEDQSTLFPKEKSQEVRLTMKKWQKKENIV